jgi:hypothetical protein
MPVCLRPSGGQSGQQQQPQLAVAPDGSPLVTSDEEFAANSMGPPERCQSMLLDAADPAGMCACLKATAIDADANGYTGDTLARIWQHAGGNYITPKKPQ